MSTIADTIANEGNKIVLDDGTELTIRYNLASFRIIEKEYGSIQAFAELLDKKEQGPALSLVTFGLWAGTKMKMPLEAFEEKLDLARFQEYAQAFANAFSGALEVMNPGEAKAAEAA